MAKWKARLTIYAVTTVEADTEDEAIELAEMDMDNSLISIKDYDVEVEQIS